MSRKRFIIRCLVFVIGFLLFALLNWGSAYYFAKEKSLRHKIYRRFNLLEFCKAISKDKTPLKVFFLGNSMQQLCIDFEFLQSSLKKTLKHDIKLYDLTQPGSSPVYYRAILSQLPVNRSTLVVIPLSYIGFAHNGLFHPDLNVFLADPSVVKTLGYNFYLKNLSFTQIWTSALNYVSPLYRYRDLIKRRFWKKVVSKENSMDDKIINIMMKEKLQIDPSTQWSELCFDQLSLFLKDLEDRSVPHLVYIQPTTTARLEKLSPIISRINGMLRSRGTNWLDLSALHQDSEFFDPYPHTDYKDQTFALLGTLQNLKPTQVKQVSPSRIGLARVNYSIQPEQIRRWGSGKILSKTRLKYPLFYGPDKRSPIGFRCSINGIEAELDYKFFKFRQETHLPRFSNWKRNFLFLFHKPRYSNLSEDQIRIQYLTYDPDLSPVTERKVNEVAGVYRLYVDSRITKSKVKRVLLDEKMPKNQKNTGTQKKSVVWKFKKGLFYIITPADLRPTVDTVNIIIDGAEKNYPDGPLASAVRKIDREINFKNN